MNKATPLKASEVEALTFIHAPDDAFASARRLAPRPGSLGLAAGGGLPAAIAWTRLAALSVLQRYGL